MTDNKTSGLRTEHLEILRQNAEPVAEIPVAARNAEIQKYRALSPLQSSAAFYDLLRQGPPACAGTSADAKAMADTSAGRPGAGPVVGYFCNLVPEELILACGAAPVRLCCADYDCARLGEKLMPAEVCPLIKSVCGAFAASARRPDVLVVPATCDGKTQLAQQLAAGGEVYFLDLPRENDYLTNGDIWAERFAAFFSFLKTRFKVRPTRADLLAACDVTNRRTRVFREIYRFRATQPRLINSYDYFAMTTASFFAAAPRWTELAKELLHETRRKAAALGAAGGRKRVLLAGSPVIFPIFKILEVLDQALCDPAADTLCSACGRLFDPVTIDEDTEDGIIRALAMKYVAASMCPCFLSAGKFLDRLIETVREFALDGVVYHVLRLCQPFDMQTALLRQVLKARRIPFLAVKTDLGREDLGQLKTRVEAFAEMLA